MKISEIIKCAVLAIILISCREKVPTLPVVAASAIKAPKQTEVPLLKGMNLEQIAGEAYGHRRMSLVVAAFNDISDEARIHAGTVIRMPAIPQMFKEAGIDREYEPVLNALAKAVQDYFEVEPVYLELRRQVEGIQPGHMSLPVGIKSTLDSVAETLEAVCGGFETVKDGHSVPRKAINQIKQAAFHVRDLASGNFDGYGYDHDLVGQRLGHGLANLLVWVKEKHQ